MDAAGAILQQLTLAPSLDAVRTALFIQPHPDDNQFGAGGLMARLCASGAAVFELTVTDDGHIPGTELDGLGRTTRQREALAAQGLLGAQNAGFLGFADMGHAGEDEIADAVLPVIRRLRPDAVFTVDPTLMGECHPDHLRVGAAVRAAVMRAGVDFYPDRPAAAPRDDAWESKVLGFYFTERPNFWADISAFVERKHAALCCHASQDPAELSGLIRLFDGRGGAARGCAAAEGFRLQSPLQRHCFPLPVAERGGVW